MVTGSSRRVVLTALAIVSVAACGGDASPEPATETAAAEATPAPTPPPPPEGGEQGFASERTGGVAGVLSESGDAEMVAVTIGDYNLKLSADSIGGGPVTVVLENTSDRAHVIEVRSEHYGRWRSAPIPPGGSGSMSMPLQSATYEIFCPEEDAAGNHREKGMVATLRVY